MCGADIFLGALAILFPPLPVWVKRGLCSADSLINLLLCCLGFLPGSLHAWYIIYSYPDQTYAAVPQQDAESQGQGQRGNVTYYYVRHEGAPQQQGRQQQGRQQQGRQQQQGKQQRGYGTVGPSAPGSQFPGQVQGSVVNQQVAGGSAAREEVPPSYQEAVGDHKVQSRE